MGCCNSQEPFNHPLPIKSRRSSISNQLSQTKRTQICKTFSSQIQCLKTSESFYSSSELSGKASSSSYKDSLQSLPFYFSQKFSDCLTDEINNLTCPECLIDFNSLNELPLNLACDHIICKSCCNQLFTEHGNIPCYYNCIPTVIHPGSLEINKITLGIIESKEKGLYCFGHNLVCYDFCVNCQKVVCTYCAESHSKHNIVKINSEAFNSEVLAWKSNLKNYQKQLEGHINKLELHKSQFLRIKQALEENLDEHCNRINDSAETIKATFSQSALDQQESLQYFVSAINEIMPINLISLYKDVIKQEIEKSEEISAKHEYLPLPLQLKMLNRVGLNTKVFVTQPNFQSWKDLEGKVGGMSQIQEFLIALNAVKLN